MVHCGGAVLTNGKPNSKTVGGNSVTSSSLRLALMVTVLQKDIEKCSGSARSVGELQQNLEW